MAIINSFGSLKTAMSRYMFQQRFAPDYDTAVQNFEAMANRRLRVLPMETMTTLTTAAGQVALPIDYLLWRTVLHTGTSPPDELEYVHPAYLGVEASGIFTIEGSTFKARPIDDTANIYEFHYYQRIPSILSSDNLTNWLLNAHSDFYLEGALTELFALGRNTEAAQLHKARRDEIMTEIIRAYALTTAASSSQVRTAEYF